MGEIASTRTMQRQGRSSGPHHVTHRWNMPEGMEPPPVGATIAGKREHWEVTEVVPVESDRYPNAFKARLRKKGPHGFDREALERLARLDGWWLYVPA